MPATTVDFGSVVVGQSADRSFTVTNTGEGTLTGAASTSAPFSIVAGGSFSLGAGASQVVVVRFTPTTVGVFSANVSFTSNGGDSSRLVTGTGTSAATRSPYKGSPFPVPGSIEAEDFDNGGEGVSWHDLTAGNQGGFYRTDTDVDIIAPTGTATGAVVNNFQAGEWLEHTISVAQAGTYRLEAHVSSEFFTSRWHAEIDGVNVTGSVAVPNTGFWSTFQWVGVGGISLSAGQHVLRVQADQEYFNFDALRITAQTNTTPLPIATDGFESGTFSGGTGWSGPWTNSGDVSIRTNVDGPEEGMSHVRLRRSTGYLQRTVNLSGAQNVHLTFWAKVRSFEGSDKALVKVSPGGVSFTTVKVFSSADSNNTYRYYDLDLSGFAMTDTFSIAFDAEMSSTNDYWFIDNIQITGVRPSP